MPVPDHRLLGQQDALIHQGSAVLQETLLIAPCAHGALSHGALWSDLLHLQPGLQRCASTLHFTTACFSVVLSKLKICLFSLWCLLLLLPLSRASESNKGTLLLIHSLLVL